ncbi:WD40 repeat-like protein [Saitoella complicata NRRL Y-17804]|nr:WD40 repeat-like protein [Saitoella complicata NRRL Y-17804]ODQ51275.1 WD40 repeat-like protein [Saitoella complicata NRRL Y-17804]
MSDLSHRKSLSGAFASTLKPPPPPHPSTHGTCHHPTPFQTYALSWSAYPSLHGPSIAVGSTSEAFDNKLRLLSTVEVDKEERGGGGVDLVVHGEIEVGYPLTKCMWQPVDGGMGSVEVLAGTSDALRLWEVCEAEPGNKKGGLKSKAVLYNKKIEHAAPLTSMDWCTLNPVNIITSSVDTTCTLWDLNTGQAKTQLIAHDKEVFDLQYVAGSTDVFASVGADGSVRMFDLRALDHSTIIYESPSSTPTPLLRLSACTRDANLLATFHLDSPTIHILDVRSPGASAIDLTAHDSTVNCVQWAPGSRNVLASGGEDGQVLVWDLKALSGAAGGDKERDSTRVLREPLLSWTGEGEVNNLGWSAAGEWVGVAWGKCVQGLKV